MDNEASEQACKALGKAVVAAVRASGSLPTGRDHEYFSTFPQFRDAVGGGKGGAGRRVLEVIDRIVTHQAPNAPKSRMAGSGMDSDEVFERVVDFADEKLEKVDCLIDEVLGRGANAKAPGVVVESRAALHGRMRGKKFGTKGTPQDLDLPKPQLRFDDHIDNSDTPFTPMVWKKIHSVGAGGGGGDGAHPYAAEVAALEYDTSQLSAPAQITEPLPMDDTPLTWVDTSAQLQQLCQALEEGCTEIGVDLEHHSVRSFQGFTCLMQISSREHDYLVDTIQLRGHMHMLLGVFTNPRITKIFHGSDSDVKWLQRDFGLYIVNLFDTGQAARVLELPSFSFAYLLESLCGQSSDKRYQLADWRLRPLPLELIQYARMDTHFLPYIYDKLRQTLSERAGGGDKLIRTVLSKSSAVSMQEYQKEVFDPNGYTLLISRSGKALTPTQTAVFAKLYAWRDQTARDKDESHHYVLPSTLLFKLATSLPKDAAAVLEACRPSVPPLVREAAERVAEIVASGLAEGGDPMSVDLAHAQQTKELGQMAVPDEGEVYVQAAWVLDDEEGGLASGAPPPEIVVAEQNKTLDSSVPGPSSLFARQVTVGASKGDAASRAKVDQVLSSLGTFPALTGASVAAKENGAAEPEASARAQPEKEEGGGAQDDADTEMPKSINEIFKLSNQNRRRNQEKKRRKTGAGGVEPEKNLEGESEDDDGEEDGEDERLRHSDMSRADVYLKGSAETAQDPEAFLKTVGWVGDKAASGKGKGGKGGDGGKGEAFKPYDYASLGGWEGASGGGGGRQQQSQAAQVPQFDPHAGVDATKGSGKQPRGQKLHGKGATYKGGGGKGKR